MESIGEFLGRARELTGMTQAEAAKLSLTSRGTLSQLEMSNANPTWSSIERYAVALGARVTLRFDLLNGHSAELLAGQSAPDLLTDLHDERDRQKRDQRFVSAIAGRFAEVLEPGRWARQNALRVLLWSAIVENLHGQALFEDDVDFGHWEDESGNWAIAGNRYVPHTVSIADRNRATFHSLAKRAEWIAEDLTDRGGTISTTMIPLPALVAYAKEGAPGARGVAGRLSSIAADTGQTDRVLSAIGYLPPDPLATTRGFPTNKTEVV
ncbi:MAG: XRE family transcriptional regulator [Actinobacteria bacterium]|nr:XRE family transcriptional regulator [Actinomycetota bacterium]